MGDGEAGIFLLRLRNAVIGCDIENIESMRHNLTSLSNSFRSLPL